MWKAASLTIQRFASKTGSYEIFHELLTILILNFTIKKFIIIINSCHWVNVNTELISTEIQN